MKVIINRRSAPTKAKNPLNGEIPYDKRYGEWGTIADVDDDNRVANSRENTVDVILDGGIYLRRVPVASREWVVPTTESDNDYATGERDLPPINARVVVMMPSGTVDDCFGLCSGFSSIDKDANAPFMEEEKEKIRERIAPGGWHTKYDCVTGSFESISPDEKTSMKIDYGTEAEAKEKPEIHLTLFEKTTLDIIDEDSATFSVFEGEVKVEHKKGDSAKVTVFDTEFTIKKGEVTMRPKKTTVEVDGDLTVKTNGKGQFMSETGLLEIGNSIATLGAMNSEFIDIVSNLDTVGSPANHSTGPISKPKLIALKQKWDKVFS